MFQALTKRGAIARGHAGFTMGELLAVIAVLVALMAVAVPNAAAYQRSLSVAELDGKAEQVYNAAQFQLSSLKTAGRLGVLDALDGDAVVPLDYAGSEGADSIRYAVKGSDAVSKYLMPTQSTLVSAGTLTGSYAIELSPSSGEVYAVYYWEDGATDAGGTAFSGTSVAAIESFYQSVSVYRPTTSGSFLADHRIGYFNGGAVSKVAPSAPGGAGGADPTTPFNPGDLQPAPADGVRLEVPVDYGMGDLGDTDFDLDQLKLSIHVQQVNSDGWMPPNNSVMVRLNGGAGNAPAMPGSNQYIDVGPDDLDVGTGIPTYILDSLEVGGNGLPMSIENRTKGLIKRGSNIQITVYVEYEGAAFVYGPYTKNSLYGSYDAETRTVEVGNIRHLVNLSNAGALDNQVTTVSFTSDVVVEAGADPIAPIDLTGILGTSNESSIEGNNCTIEGIVIGDEADPPDNAGLFSYLRVNMRDLTLKDATVFGGNNVGALVGNQANSGISIENCKVVGGTVTGKSNVGGLVGTAVGAMPYSNCSSTASVVATGAGPAGGFVGSTTTSTFANCTVGSPAAPVSVAGTGSDSSRIGGFAGQVLPSGNKLSGCQAYANVSGRDYVGGFIGRVEADAWSHIEDCLAAASYDADGNPAFQSVSGRSYVGGFVGGAVDLNALSGCLAQVNVSGSGDYVGGFAGSLATTGSVENCTVPGVGAKFPTYRGSGSNVGAFAGFNASTLVECWSRAVSA